MLLRYFFIFFVLTTSFSSGLISQAPPQDNNFRENIFNAVLEESNLWGFEYKLDFGHQGNWEERPDGIEMINVSVKLIPSIEENEDAFIVAYQATVGLKPQAEKIAERSSKNGETCFVNSYKVDFNFYFLDEDGYCLRKISTENKKTLHSPGAYTLSIKPGNKPELIREVLINEKIPSSLARRIKKVSYFPIFCVNSWKHEKE